MSPSSTVHRRAAGVSIHPAEAWTGTIAVIHPKGGVGRSTSSWALGAELALHGCSVRIEDLDQAKHLTSIVRRRDLLVPGLTIGAEGTADVVPLDTAPEADAARGIGYLRRADWALVPVKGPEEASVQAVGLVLEWLKAAPNCRMLGFLPTMATLRCSESRSWPEELERLAERCGTHVFSPITARASLAAWRLDGHPCAPLAEAVLHALRA